MEDLRRGFYMLLDPTNAKGGQKSTLVSPKTQSSGCLSLSFHYTLRGSSPGAALSVYAQAVGSIRKHTLFSGQPAAGWQPVSVNYTGQGALQFIIVGMFGKEPEPAVAVDEISIVPCGETLPRCDFEDDDHPFCDWSQVAESGGEWTRGSRTSPGTHFIYLASNKFSQEGQNFRLLSRPFCAPATICVEFSYSMFGLGNGTTLKLLLGSPAGSRPKSLWCQQGSQKPDWLKTSITVPSGLPQPMQLILSAVGGSNVAFIVAVGFIGINHGACREICPANAHFERCGCLASCSNPRPSCGSHCVSGCVCNSGYLFSNNSCTEASSCSCFYNNNYYKVGDTWFSSNCSERCRCLPGSHTRCHMAHCGTNSVCQLKNGQYGCHPYGSAICSVYGDTNYLTFDGRHFRFMGKCTYVLAQSCGNLTEPFFRVTAKNEGRGQEGMSCVSKVYVTLHEIAVTLLKDRRVLVGGQLATLPANPSSGVFLFPSGRFVELQTPFGVWLRWDGDQQLYLSVPSAYAGKLCGFCGNYDGDKSNDKQKPDGKMAADEEELGRSWRTAEDEDKECQKGHVSPPSCNLALLSRLSGPKMCGLLVEERGPFSACLPHVPVTTFFRNCLFDMCNFQGMQQMLCTHLAALTETCQEAGLAVKPWRGPEFCPLSCPAFSKYTLCGKSCPGICHSNFSGVSCRDRCAEGCQCDPGYVLSGLQCVHAGQCGCLDPTRGYFKVGEQWYKPGCRQLCVCEAKQDIRCFPAKCSEREVCNLQEGKYGCHPQGYGVCTISGDSHIQTFDGALSHFLGTCTYVLTKPCSARVFESHFVVSASSEFRLGNQDTTFVSAVHVEVYKVKISMLKGSRVVLNGQRVLPPLRLLQGRLLVRLSGVFLRLSTDFGLQVRYDGNHLVEVKVPSTYAHRLCGLCGNYNNKTLDDNELVDRNHPWKIREASEAGCYTTIKSQSCVKKESLEPWENNCSILLNPQGPFSQCHQVVSPNASFFSCMTSQCVSKGSPLALCRSLQAYATLCASAGQALSWRNSSVCPLPCPSGSSYSPCANPCPATCLDMFSPTDCGPALPCTEGCECQEGYILSGTSCVPLSQCGCTQGPDAYHAVGESWYSDETCSKLCSCSASNNASCHQASCGRNQQCWALDGLTRCRSAYVGVCSSVLQEHYYYVSFDGTQHTLGGNCSYILAMSCHYTANTHFFKITSQNGPLEGAACTLTQQIIVQAFDLQITMQKNHGINGTQVQLPYKDQGVGLEGEFPKQRFSVTAANDSIQLTLSIGLIVNFKSDGSYLQIQVPGAYYKKVCGICGNYNGEQEDELMMPSDELAQSDAEFVTSWQDKEFSLNCPSDAQKAQTEPTPQPESSCWQADLSQAQEQCQAAFQSPAWVSCSAHVSLEPYLLRCVHSLCRFGGLNQALCESLQAFEAACQAQGFKPHIWRNSSFCPLECPAHSSYTTCMGPCVPACGKAKCSTQPQPEAGCREGCVCQPGFLLSKKLCVPESHCSCTNPEGRPLPGGQMWVSKDCAQSCMCTAGTLRCEPFSCPFGSHCQPIPQEGGSCKPDRSQLCSVFGDSHYLTFDGLLYTFPGRMTYTLLRTVSELPRGLEPVVVEGRNHASTRSPDPKSVYTLQEVTVRIQGHVIQMQSNLRLVVNNQRMTVPFSPSKYLQVSLRGHRMYLVTSFELVVSFDGKDNAVISLPTTYQGLVQGLCGNFDKDKWNDFTTPSGTPVQDASVFGSSWEVKTNPRGLRRLSRAVREEDEGPAPCSGEQRALSNSSHACGVLLDPQGPFAACHRVVAPEPFQEHCVLALCARREPGLHEELRCRLLGGYASTCQEAGSTLGGWREHTRCALACPANTIYRSCMSPCPASCASLAAPGACTGPCVEGCASLPGFAYSGAQSLPHSHCGCTRDGRYYQGESVVSEDCSQRCTCARPGLLLCRPLHCGPGETCTLGNLTRGCFRESPCLQNPCQNDGRCVERGNRFVCECESGYGGDLCSEPGDRPRPPEPDTSSLVPIGLGTLVLMTALALAQLCASRTRRKRMQ
ncbi:zonadhesin [Sorex araneus]|uniref:zonadhesin n=1 Tax=Sorex araneus TaxID=42254 RepID=UPI0024340BEC|nr:zonadhesin [Sorex araneus]